MNEDLGRAKGVVRRNTRAVVASVVLLGAFGWILNEGALPLVPRKEAFAHLDVWGVVWMSLTLMTAILLRLGRCHFLFAPIARISFTRLMSVSFVALGLLTFLPLRLGEMARPAMLREKGKLSAIAVTSAIGAERIIDGVVFSAALLIGLAFAQPHTPLPERIGDLPVPAALVPRAAQVAALVFGAAFVLMAAFYFWRSFARRMTERVLGVFSQRLAARVAGLIERLSEGLRFLTDIKHASLFVLATIAAHLIQVLGIAVLSNAVGLADLTFAQANVVLGVLALGFALPNAPGFFGAFQLALYAGLAVYVSAERVVQEGAAFVFIYYAVYIAEVVFLAIVGILAEYRLSASESAVVGPSRSEKAM